jgi:hypothetical protein
LEPLRRKFPDVDDESLLFAHFIDGFAAIVLRQTNAALERKGLRAIDGYELSSFLGNFVRANCVILSDRAKWKIVTDDQEDKFSVERFSSIGNNLHCLSLDSDLGEVSGTDPLARQQELSFVEKLLNDSLQSVVKSRFLTIDDDVLLTKSKEATVQRLGHVIRNERKGDGVSINVCSELYTSVVTGFTTTVRGGGDSLSRVRIQCNLKAGSKVLGDRGYIRLPAVQLNQAMLIGTFGILNDKFKKDRGISFVHSDSEDFSSPLDKSLAIECFPGAGSYMKVAKLKGTSIFNVCAVQTLTGSPKIVSYLTSDVIEESMFSKYVRIPTSIKVADRKSVLSVCAENEEPIAQFICTRLGG